jgi:hypothetical protein
MQKDRFNPPPSGPGDIIENYRCRVLTRPSFETPIRCTTRRPTVVPVQNTYFSANCMIRGSPEDRPLVPLMSLWIFPNVP